MKPELGLNFEGTSVVPKSMETLKVLTLSPDKCRRLPRGKKPPMPEWMVKECEQAKKRLNNKSTK